MILPVTRPRLEQIIHDQFVMLNGPKVTLAKNYAEVVSVILAAADAYAGVAPLPAEMAGKIRRSAAWAEARRLHPDMPMRRLAKINPYAARDRGEQG